jgi:hypothetical protein
LLYGSLRYRRKKEGSGRVDLEGDCLSWGKEDRRIINRY